MVCSILQIFQNKTFSKMSSAEYCSPRISPFSSSPKASRDVLWADLLAFCDPLLISDSAPAGLSSCTWHLDRNLFLAPDGIAAFPVWSSQHIFPGTWFLDMAAVKPTGMTWPAPLEKVFPTLRPSCIWAGCFPELWNKPSKALGLQCKILDSCRCSRRRSGLNGKGGTQVLGY